MFRSFRFVYVYGKCVFYGHAKSMNVRDCLCIHMFVYTYVCVYICLCIHMRVFARVLLFLLLFYETTMRSLTMCINPSTPVMFPPQHGTRLRRRSITPIAHLSFPPSYSTSSWPSPGKHSARPTWRR